MKPLGLFVDDIRDPPENDGVNWIVCRTFHMAICFLEGTVFAVVSLDHDLGCFYGQREMTGRDILNWLIARKLSGNPDAHVPQEVRVHSANPVGCDTMEADIKRYWS
jgi:hypothetical protein